MQAPGDGGGARVVVDVMRSDCGYFEGGAADGCEGERKRSQDDSEVFYLSSEKDEVTI